jgi:pimeloyl-ACP methyl ester carboxylesterase
MDNKVNRHVVLVDGMRVAITESGSGPALVLVHGLGGPSMWMRVIEPLGRHFHVVAVDLPGFGHSDSPPSPLSLHQNAEFLDHFFRVLGLEKCTLAGISYGGQIAATTAINFPDRVERLVLLATTGFDDHPAIRKRFIWLFVRYCVKNLVFKSAALTSLLGRRSFYDIRNRPKNLHREFLSQFTDKGKTDMWLEALRNTFDIDTDSVTKLNLSGVPVIILWGKNDRVVSPAVALELHRRIPRSQVRIVEECGHSLPLEKPIEMIAELREVLYRSRGKSL